MRMRIPSPPRTANRLPFAQLRVLQPQLALKEVLLALYLLLHLPSAVDRVYQLGVTHGLILHALLHAGLLTCLLTMLVAAGYTRSPVTRWGVGLLLALAAFVHGGYQHITGEFFSYEAFLNMREAADSGSEAARHYASRLAVIALDSLLLLVGIGMAPRWRPVPSGMAGLAPWGGTGILSMDLFVLGGDGAQGLPAPFVTLSYSTLYLVERATSQIGERSAVAIIPKSAPPSGDLVLIVDESITATYLDINSPRGVASGLQHARSGVHVSNFGIAASISNCSAATNQTLRFGGTRADYRRINSTQPSIWAYAHMAKRKTVYLDAQREGGALQNGMTAEERREIDTFIQFDTVALQDRDMAAARELARHLNNGIPEFILLNKLGAHFPIADKYPESHARFHSALHRGGAVKVADVSMSDTFRESINWQRYRNAYRNTVTWNVGAFFEGLLSSADLGRSTIIYTADHGQNLREHGVGGEATHCTESAVSEEGAVPLVVVSGDRGSMWSWDRVAHRNRDRASHYQLFPTLLVLMGYEPEAVRSRYGTTLADTLRDPLTFNTRFHARLGKKPRWIAIDPSRLAHPPLGDVETVLTER